MSRSFVWGTAYLVLTAHRVGCVSQNRREQPTRIAADGDTLRCGFGGVLAGAAFHIAREVEAASKAWDVLRDPRVRRAAPRCGWPSGPQRLKCGKNAYLYCHILYPYCEQLGHADVSTFIRDTRSKV